MDTKKITLIWRILRNYKSLEGQMHLLMLLQDYTKQVQIKLVEDASEQGAITTLQALRAIVVEKIK